MFDMVELTFSGMSWEEAAAERISDPVIAHTVDIFSRYGVIFLLFLVGLESSIPEMREAGVVSMRVALVGMLTPFILGLSVAWLVLPDNPVSTLLFIAATLGATSVGITARVLKDMDCLNSTESHVILGAAVFDDVLGLISLAIVSGIVISGTISGYAMLQVVGLATLFVVAAFYAGPLILKGMIYSIRSLDLLSAKIFISLMFVMALAWFANLVGLATIIGAFAAGLILNDCYFKYWGEDCAKHRYSVSDLMAPLEAILAPIFFVLIGLQVKLESFLDRDILIFSTGLTVAAILGKLASGFAAKRSLNRWMIGFGMMPRGEVGLVFASIGRSLEVIDDTLFSSIVPMVVITTVATPTLLKLSHRHGRPPKVAN